MAVTKETAAAQAERAKASAADDGGKAATVAEAKATAGVNAGTDEGKAATVAEAKATAGVNAGTDEAGSLEDVEALQGGSPTAEPGAAFSSGYDAESVGKEQRAIKKEAERLAAVNAETEAKAKDDEANALGALDRIKRIEQRQGTIIAALLAMEDKRPVNKEALEAARG